MLACPMALDCQAPHRFMKVAPFSDAIVPYHGLDIQGIPHQEERQLRGLRRQEENARCEMIGDD
ncbi:MAG TPA: hypothetical protein DCP92_24920 [Nitrospiraceae bacterium]|nr:hypothetical protein [Nitrospiraceae bacterium]